MPRPPLPIGTWGRIRREHAGPRSFRARCRFRDYDGLTRDVEAWGETGAAAERALLRMLRERTTPTGDEVTRDARLTKLAELWLQAVIADEEISPQTIDRYKTSLRTTIIPALGNLRIREVTVGRLEQFFRSLRTQPGKARGARTVLSRMLAMAVRHGALGHNPIRELERKRRKRRGARALTADDLHEVRTAIRRWQNPPTARPGPRHTSDLAEVIDLMLATGARISETLAVRSADLDLAAFPATVTISGTLVYVKGRGYFRQEWTKTDAGYRTVTLPRFATDMLLRRQATAGSNPHGAIFCSRRGTWLSPHNVRRQWREARKATGLQWVTPHTFRKTVATLIEQEADIKTAAAQLGHASETVTDQYYIDKAKRAPDSSHLLERLGQPARP
jgi:integrase